MHGLYHYAKCTHLAKGYGLDQVIVGACPTESNQVGGPNKHNWFLEAYQLPIERFVLNS